MKILWFHSCVAEVEHDVFMSCIQHNMYYDVWTQVHNTSIFIDLEIYYVKNEYGVDNAPKLGPFFKIIDTRSISKIIELSNPDLIIFRYPQGWYYPFQYLNKIVCWTSEQGPTRQSAMDSCSPFTNIGVNNKYEIDLYKNRFPNKKILYLPFCGKEIDTDYNNTIYDVVASCNPHYVCGCGDGKKKHSVETMILPLLNNNYNFHAFGMAVSEHGWNAIPGISEANLSWFPYHWYAKYIQLGKLYVDVTFNWADGGYGCKLSRALAAGVPTIWQKTIGMELDGFEKGNQLDWSSSPEETLSLVDYYLSHDKERIEMGKRGHEWCQNNWLWSKNLIRIAEEIK